MNRIYMLEFEYEGLLHAEKLLSECMELADFIARENREWGEEWSNAYQALYAVKNLIKSYECDDEPIPLFDCNALPF